MWSRVPHANRLLGNADHHKAIVFWRWRGIGTWVKFNKTHDLRLEIIKVTFSNFTTGSFPLNVKRLLKVFPSSKTMTNKTFSYYTDLIFILPCCFSRNTWDNTMRQHHEQVYHLVLFSSNWSYYTLSVPCVHILIPAMEARAIECCALCSGDWCSLLL